MKKTLFVAAVVYLAMVVSTVPAFANTIVVTSTPIITGPGPYTWTYSVTLNGNSSIDTGDFFTILDFDGFQVGSQSVNLNWLATSSNLGACPTGSVGGTPGIFANCLGLDDAAIPNITWTYNGNLLVNPTPGTPLSLGNFSAVSIYNQPKNDQFFSQDNDVQTGSQNEAASGGTNVPTATPVPEPGSLLLLGSGLLSLAAFARGKVAK